MRWDETWHRLRDWTSGQGPSERLAALVLGHEGFSALDPSHPLGGRDGGKDAVCTKDGRQWIMAVYFPRGQQDFNAIEDKFLSDLEGAKEAGSGAFVFVTNQELRLAERHSLAEAWPGQIEIYHLERLTVVLDSPEMGNVRSQFLGIEPSAAGTGGAGGSATAMGDRATAIGGRGGQGGAGGCGGDGGNAVADGEDVVAIGGDGGNAGTADGRGGRGAPSPAERMAMATEMWQFGRGGAGANAPEYNRRIDLLTRVRREYLDMFPDRAPFVNAGIDPVPINWVNKRLEELNETWRIEMGSGGYILPPL